MQFYDYFIMLFSLRIPRTGQLKKVVDLIECQVEKKPELTSLNKLFGHV